MPDPKPLPLAIATDQEALDHRDADAPPESFGPPIGPKRGKPRRAEFTARVRSVRIDDEAANTLELQFGSLGNALYHIFRGVQEFQIRLPALAAAANRTKSDPKQPDPALAAKPVPQALSESDWYLISSTIQQQADRLNVAEIPLDASNGSPLLRPTASMKQAEALEIALRRLEIALGRPKRGTPY